MYVKDVRAEAHTNTDAILGIQELRTALIWNSSPKVTVEWANTPEGNSLPFNVHSTVQFLAYGQLFKNLDIAPSRVLNVPASLIS